MLNLRKPNAEMVPSLESPVIAVISCTSKPICPPISISSSSAHLEESRVEESIMFDDLDKEVCNRVKILHTCISVVIN